VAEAEEEVVAAVHRGADEVASGVEEGTVVAMEVVTVPLVEAIGEDSEGAVVEATLLTNRLDLCLGSSRRVQAGPGLGV
jgi:hypothetical protein